ncbi:MAG: thiamine pyrophosphate-binding protein, partial [Nitrososphaeria archaeon]
KGSDLLVEELKRYGVEWVAVLCGNGLDPFLVSCCKIGIRVVDTHNEQAAAYMADTYARLTGKIGVCAVSSGVAHANAMTGIVNSFFDGAPVLLITGASHGFGAGRGVFQELDQPGLAAPVCKYSKTVRKVEDLKFMLNQALNAALSGRYGPVHLTVPLDVMEGTLEQNQGSYATQQFFPKSSPMLDSEVAHKVSELIRDSQRPLLIAGTGVFYAQAQKELIAFSEVTGVPIVTPIWDRGSVDRPHPNFMGVVGAASGEPRLLADADLILMAGGQVDYRVGYLSPPAIQEDAKIIRLDWDPNRLYQGVEPELALFVDLSKGFEQITQQYSNMGANPHSEWLREARERSRRFRERWVEAPVPDSPMTGRHIVDAIRPLLDEDVVFLIDGGNIGQWAHMALASDRYPGSWLTCGASAVVGWGLPGAMAAKLTFPDKKVLLLSGDGSFGFTITELEAAIRQRLPFVAVVANDSSWGIALCAQKKSYGGEGTIATKTSEIRFDKIAEAFGAFGINVEEPKKIKDIVREGFARDRPTVINVPISVAGPYSW